MDLSLPRFAPPRVTPPARQLNRLAFAAAFVRNPLCTIPQAAYEEDFVPMRGSSGTRAWITAPALIKAVLLDERDKFGKLMQIRLLRPLLGKGILTSEGADWRWQRQAAAPMFRVPDLGGFVPTFVRAAEDTLARWRARPAGSVHEIDEEMTRATFDVIAATLLPSHDERFRDDVQDSVRAFQRFGGWGILYASLNLPKWMPRPGMGEEPGIVSLLRARVMELAQARRRDMDAGRDTPDDLLHRLIESRDPETGRTMDDERVVDNLLTFYMAGHETTAKALTWALYLLARSPEWTAALADEVANVTGGATVASGHIERLALVQQVIKESMRLYPPVPMMSRQAIAPVEIGGHAFEPGASIIMPVYAIHRHAKRWENPDMFDPTRFSPGKESSVARYQYMPFGAGPRVCVGMSFAMIEATAILATLLQRARFEPARADEPTPIARVTLLPKGGMPLRVRLL